MTSWKIWHTYLLTISLGSIGGLLAWSYWGCGDSCVLWSSPVWMTLRGALLGVCVAIILHPSSSIQKEQ